VETGAVAQDWHEPGPGQSLIFHGAKDDTIGQALLVRRGLLVGLRHPSEERRNLRRAVCQISTATS
jgi:hypothetical protein